MMTPFKRKTLPLLIATLALSMGGCGGGGGGGGGGTTGVTLNGTAAKGIIKNGIVTAEELKSDGTVLRTVGNATTVADGSYELDVDGSYEGGPIKITITTDDTTEMKCDVSAGCGSRTDGITDTNSSIDFGEWYKPGPLTMKALVAEAAAGDSISANVTPYTDLAASQVLAAGTVDKSAVYNANSEVSTMLGGIDILNTRPLDITDPAVDGTANEKAYAAFGSAIAALATPDADGHPDINAALSTLSTSFSGGKIVTDDTAATNKDEIFSLQELITAASDTFTEAGISDTSGVVAELQDDVDSAVDTDSDGLPDIDPEPSGTAGSATLTKVKSFVGDVRTWGTVIGDEMRAKNNAFDQQTSLASDAADMSRQLLINPALEAALDAIALNFDGIQTGTELSSYGVGFTSGTISKSNGIFTITNGVIGGVTVNMSASTPVDGANTNSYTIGITSATFRSAAADADIKKGTVVLNLAENYAINHDAIKAGTAPMPVISGVSINLDVSLTQKQDGGGNPLSAQITFAGTLSATLSNPITDSVTDEYTWITPSTLSLGGKISSSAGHSMEATFTANITNASTFTPVGALPVGTVTPNIVSWANANTDSVPGDDTFTLTQPDGSTSIHWNSADGFTTVTYDYSGVSEEYSFGTYADFAAAKAEFTSSYTSMYAYTDQGYYTVDLSSANFSVDGSASGTLEYANFVLEGSGANQWLDADVGLNFGLQLQGLPKASVNITGDRTGLKDGTAAITIAYGTRKIEISGTFTDGNATGESVVITNQDGVELTIIPGTDNKSGDIKFNGTKYATIEQLSSGLVKISYTDGTFETL